MPRDSILLAKYRVQYNYESERMGREWTNYSAHACRDKAEKAMKEMMKVHSDIKWRTIEDNSTVSLDHYLATNELRKRTRTCIQNMGVANRMALLVCARQLGGDVHSVM